jgi:hypothetical protein
MRVAVFRTHIDFFLGEAQDDTHDEWFVEEFRDRCIHEMVDAGFDMGRRIYCHYDSDSGNVTFWQEPTEAMNDTLFNLN